MTVFKILLKSCESNFIANKASAVSGSINISSFAKGHKIYAGTLHPGPLNASLVKIKSLEIIKRCDKWFLIKNNVM